VNLTDAQRRTIRTTVQLVIFVCAMLPGLVQTVGLSPDTMPWLAAALAVAATVTRIMASPQAEQFLAKWAPWLAMNPRDGAHEAGRREDGEAGQAGAVFLAWAAALFVVVLAASLIALAAPAHAAARGPVLPVVASARDCDGTMVVEYGLQLLSGRDLQVVLDDGRERLEVLEVSGRSGPNGTWQQVPAVSGGEGVLRWPGLAAAQDQGGHYGAARVVRTDHGRVRSLRAVVTSGCVA
jgi:hypothetical protein